MRISQRLTALVSMPMIAILMAFVGLSVTSVAAAPESQAVTYNTFKRAYGVWMPAGTGRPYGGWVGTHQGYAPTGEFLRGACVDRNLNMANASDIVTTTSVLPLATTDESQRMRTLANKYAHTTDWVTAKRLSVATWKIQDPAIINTYMTEMTKKYYYESRVGKTIQYLSAADITAINAMVGESERHGPFTASINGSAVGVGKTTTVTLTTRSAHGYYPLAGGVATFSTTTNARITSINGVAGASTGVISATGTATATVLVTGPNQVTVAGRGTFPSSGAVLMNVRSSTSVQRLIGGNLKEFVVAKMAFEKKVSGPSFSSTCSTNCDGTGTLTVNVCLDAGNNPVKHAVVKAGGEVIGYIDVAPGTCAPAKQFPVTDGTVIASKYCFTATLGGACISGWTSNPGSFGVVCPAWIKVAITIGCNCGTAWGNIALSNPVTSRHNVATIEVAEPGKAVVTTNYPLASGENKIVPLTSPLTAGTVITVKWTSYYSATNLTVIPGYNLKTMESVQLIFGGGTSANQVDSASDVKVLADTKSGSISVGGRTVS